MSKNQWITVNGNRLAKIPARALCFVIALFGIAASLLHAGLAVGSGSPLMFLSAFVSVCWTLTAVVAGLRSDDELAKRSQSILFVAALMIGMAILAICAWWFLLLTAFGESRLSALLLISPFALVAILLPIVIWVRAQNVAGEKPADLC